MAHNHPGALVAAKIPGRTGKQCRERWTWTNPANKASRSWTEDEDILLISLQKRHGNKWTSIAKHLPGRLNGAAKNRWHCLKNGKGNVKRRTTAAARDKTETVHETTVATPLALLVPLPPSHWTEEEDMLLIYLQKKHGNKWTRIADHLPGRSTGSLKYRWNRLDRMGAVYNQNGKGSICGNANVGNKHTLLSTKKDFNTAYTTPAKTAHKCPTSAGSGSIMAAATLSAMRRGIFTPLDVNATTKYEPSAGQESEYHRQQMADGYSLQQSVEESSMYAHPPLPSYSGDNYHESRPFVPQLFHPVAAQDIFSPSFHAPKMSMPTTAYSTPAVPLAMTSDCFSGPFIADTPLFKQKTADCINGTMSANLFSSRGDDDDFPSTPLPYDMSSRLHYNCAV